MYTSFDKIQDRFGFNTGGTFKCAFTHTRVILGVFMGVIAVLAILIIVNIIYLFCMFDNKGSIGEIINVKRLFELAAHTASISAEQGVGELTDYSERAMEATGQISDYTDEGGHKLMEAFSPDLINFSVTCMATGFGLYLLAILLIAFLIVSATMKMGQTYKFKADDTLFTIIYPKKMNKTLAIEYDYILGIKDEEWKFPFAPKCLDVTIQTKEGDFTFRVVHTPMSRANGIYETPFNIIREKIGLQKETDTYLLHKQDGRA